MRKEYPLKIEWEVRSNTTSTSNLLVCTKKAYFYKKRHVFLRWKPDIRMKQERKKKKDEMKDLSRLLNVSFNKKSLHQRLNPFFHFLYCHSCTCKLTESFFSDLYKYMTIDISKLQHDLLLYNELSASTFLFLFYLFYAIRFLFTFLN